MTIQDQSRSPQTVSGLGLILNAQYVRACTLIVNPRKLEHGLRMICPGIPDALLKEHEDNDCSSFLAVTIPYPLEALILDPLEALILDPNYNYMELMGILHFSRLR